MPRLIGIPCIMPDCDFGSQPPCFFGRRCGEVGIRGVGCWRGREEPAKDVAGVGKAGGKPSQVYCDPLGQSSASDALMRPRLFLLPGWFLQSLCR